MTARADTPEGDELDVLVTLVEAYEAKHYAIDAPDPIAAIHHRVEAMGRKVIHTGVEGIHKAVQGRDCGPGFRPPHRRRERSELP
ncbi:MAG: hypothetical protein U1A06_07865 [Hoeflea sp.]|nr:hypothetical protein [Hoeflea sp.]